LPSQWNTEAFKILMAFCDTQSFPAEKNGKTSNCNYAYSEQDNIKVSELTKFYVPPDTQQVISETYIHNEKETEYGLTTASFKTMPHLANKSKHNSKTAHIFQCCFPSRWPEITTD